MAARRGSAASAQRRMRSMAVSATQSAACCTQRAGTRCRPPLPQAGRASGQARSLSLPNRPGWPTRRCSRRDRATSIPSGSDRHHRTVGCDGGAGRPAHSFRRPVLRHPRRRWYHWLLASTSVTATRGWGRIRTSVSAQEKPPARPRAIREIAAVATALQDLGQDHLARGFVFAPLTCTACLMRS